MISPKVFSKKTGISYAQVRNLAQKGEIRCLISPGGNISIHESELDRYCNPHNYVHLDEYNKVLAENIKLRTLFNAISQIVSDSEDEQEEMIREVAT